MAIDALQNSLHAHLAQWGLRLFSSDAEYFAWQRTALPAGDLNRLNDLAERKRSGSPLDEIAFYDLTADSRILPVLYSQRYEYYCEIGVRVAARIGEAETILDFGCGVGILTTFFAALHPDKQFVGVDRSPLSISVATSMAGRLGLKNVRFECRDFEAEACAVTYDLIVATHALVQAEQDPGMPSLSWHTFERARDADAQSAFEQRTGIDRRLDALAAALGEGGRMIVFEKTRQLSRRVPFQRALAGRGLQLVEVPEPVRYRLVEEIAEDGPFYVVQKRSFCVLAWNEEPEPDEGMPLHRGFLQSGPTDCDAPLYENHWPSAQEAWISLADRLVQREDTRRGPDGRQLHVELGTAEGQTYLYCANTFDQRQLIVVTPSRKELLESYYREILSS